MKVGDYVRTKNKAPFEPSQIAKITDMKKDEGYKNQYFITLDHNLPTTYNFHIYSEDVIKSNPNIIDLIEKSDLLKIEYYSLRYEQRVERLFEVAFKEDNYIVLENTHCDFRIIDGEWLENDKELQPIIKSIVTKEQFEVMKYEIK